MASLIQPNQLKCCTSPDWQPRAYACRCCGTRIEADFAPQEFSNLSSDELHFLRIFVWAEGRVKEMEGPLGMSYPTIRSRLSQLREKIFAGHALELPSESPREDETPEPSKSETPSASTATSAAKKSESPQPKSKTATSNQDILEALARKEISFEEAMKKLKN